MQKNILPAHELLKLILILLEEKKAVNSVTIDLSNKSSITDYLVIASGNSARQVGAMAEFLREELKKHHLTVSIEGMPQGDWVLLDAGDVVVHLFRPDVRAFYNLEKMWAVDLADSSFPPDSSSFALNKKVASH